jgi:hypothetical protein
MVLQACHDKHNNISAGYIKYSGGAIVTFYSIVCMNIVLTEAVRFSLSSVAKWRTDLSMHGFF